MIIIYIVSFSQEFDHPYNLLRNEYGFLSNMVKETGETMIEALKNVAQQNYELHHPSSMITF